MMSLSKASSSASASLIATFSSISLYLCHFAVTCESCLICTSPGSENEWWSWSNSSIEAAEWSFPVSEPVKIDQLLDPGTNTLVFDAGWSNSAQQES